MLDAEAAWPRRSHVLRGTLIAALSLFDWTEQMALRLAERGWKIVPFAQRQRAAIPAAFPGPQDTGPHGIPDPIDPPDGEGFAEIVEELTLRPLQNPASPFPDFLPGDAPAWRAPAVARYAHEMLAAFPYGDQARAQITAAFAGVPLRQPPELLPDTRESAQFSAALEARATPATHRCPEAHLSDAEFRRIAGIDKDQFYQMPRKTQREMRERLFPPT
jgi:hypothetical protein